MFSVLDGEDISDLCWIIDLVENAVIADSEGKFALMVVGKRLAFS